MDCLYIIIPAIFLLFILTLIIIFHFKKKKVLKKVCSLRADEKNKILNAMAEPLGFAYNSCQDIFTSRLDATQKIFGYTTFYDLTAPYFNMVFDYEPIYFDYKKRTWLIEIWKGQYGINSGCELGVYHADQLISPDKYNSTIFKAASPDDMPDISLFLCRMYCKWFNFVTRPFKKSGDKLLYIFYYLPFVSKRICRPKRKK